MQFNTSLLGTTLVNKALSAEGGAGAVPTSALANLPPSATIPPSATTALPPALATQIAGLNVSQIAQQIAQDLNIHDFYKLHVLSAYCEGYYEPGPVINSSNPNPSQNITFCAPPKALAFFNATQVLQNELKPGVSLDDLQWPEAIEDAIDGMAAVQKVMFILYCIGCGFAGLAVLEAIIAFLVDGRLSAVCNAVLDVFAFVALAVASGCATGFIYVVQNAVNTVSVSWCKAEEVAHLVIVRSPGQRASLQRNQFPCHYLDSHASAAGRDDRLVHRLLRWTR